MTVTEKLAALLAAANETTGETKTDLTEAVQALIDGYGGGGDPEKGVIFDDYNGSGQPTKLKVVGFDSVPENYLRGICDYSQNSSFGNKIRTIEFAEGTTTIGANAAYSSRAVSSIVLPSTVTRIEEAAFRAIQNMTSIVFPAGLIYTGMSILRECTKLETVTYLGNVPNISSQQFRGTIVSLYDFSRHTGSVPTLYDAGEAIAHTAGCVIKVPQVMLNDWMAETNWNALTDVVWQGV